MGKIYTIFNNDGEFSIYAFYTITRIKILAIFKESNPNQLIVEEDISNFCLNVYKLYKKQLLQAFSTFESTGRFSQQFHEQLDSYILKTTFKTVEKNK